MAFDILIAPGGQYSIVTLRDLNANCTVEIYSFGALLNRFAASHHEAVINVVEGFTSIDDAVENLTPFFRSAKLSPFVCRVKNGHYRFGQSEYELTKYTSNGNALHGLIYDASFSIAKQWSNETEAGVVLQHVYDNGTEGFPFRYRCNVEYKLSAGNSLSVTTTITNIDEQLMPVADGWHPYFTLGDTVNDYLVEFQSKAMLKFDEGLIPTGKLLPYEEFGSLKLFGSTFFDNCLTVNFAECQPLCVIRNPTKKIQLEVYPEASYPYLQFYTPDSRKSIAIENLSAAPDAFNNGIGLKVLQPGEEAVFSVTYVIRSL